jgi:uncharacterized DUF497 family protein
VPPVYELEIPEFAEVKLGRRNISAEEAEQLLWNDPELVVNPRSPLGRDRQRLVGKTDGGRRLTLVVESTADPTTWIAITGWDS